MRQYLSIDHNFNWTNIYGSYRYFGKWLINRLYDPATAREACIDQLAHIIRLNFEGDIFDLAYYMKTRLTKKAVITAT